MASPNLSEMTSTTIKYYSETIADNMSDNNALYGQMKKRGNTKSVGGGETILQRVEYADNTTYKRYSGYDVLNISPSDVISAAEFNWKQVAIAVTISGLEQLQNTSKEQISDLLEVRVKNAGRSFINGMSVDMYSSGTADGGKQVGGLQLLVADDPTTGSVGGIDRATYTFWQNQLWDFSAESVTVGSSTMQDAMNTLWMRCHRGADNTDLIVFDNVYYQHYWDSLTAIQRITSAETGSSGFDKIFYKANIPVVLDGGQGGACPASHGYFLNTNYIHWRPHAKYATGPGPEDERKATNQDAIVKLMLWAGNMTISNSALQGVMHA
jgi:hypothetical protein